MGVRLTQHDEEHECALVPRCERGSLALNVPIAAQHPLPLHLLLVQTLALLGVILLIDELPPARRLCRLSPVEHGGRGRRGRCR